MKREQLIKLLKIGIVATIIILVFEIIFAIPSVNEWFKQIITNANGIMIYFAIFLIMFLQCTILNIPAYVILSASISLNLNVFSWQYLLTVIGAYMCGCILAYWLGRWFGTKAVKWCAGSQEDFDKWSLVLNNKGKKWYFASVILPIFPDDILCIVAGSLKFHFGFYVIANLIGRSVGLLATLLTLNFIGLSSGGFPIMLVVWVIALLVEIISLIIIKKREC